MLGFALDVGHAAVVEDELHVRGEVGERDAEGDLAGEQAEVEGQAGGAEAAVQLAGGHVDSHVNNPSESVGQWKGGTQRPICVFNTKHLAAGPKITATEGWSDIPTCIEAGLNIPLFQQPRTVWLPLKVTPEQTAFYVDLMKKVQATPEWKDYVEKSSQSQVFLTGKEFTDYMTQDSERVHKVAEEQGWLVK